MCGNITQHGIQRPIQDPACIRDPAYISGLMVNTSLMTVNCIATKNKATRNAWQSLAYSPLGAIESPPSEYL